ncbi:MAG: N-acetylglucosamine-6-phosphate deacetylase [Clostridia bacterium]|nr:N-acetylglucosamine-6-phosphate deacetylase [Clostridia bacterium]
MKEKWMIRNAKIIRGDEILEGYALLCANGEIEGILPNEQAAQTNGYREYDAKGMYVSAGFVDTHVHGGGGADFMDDGDDTYKKCIYAHMRHGTTSIMPTTLAAETAHFRRAIRRYNQAKQDQEIGKYLVGLHMEGPYFSPAQAGAQKPERIRDFTEWEYTELIDLAEGNIRRWSAAPELSGAEKFAAYAKEKGIVLSIAHSDADFDTVVKAYDWGFCHATHLYSGMSTVSRKKGFRIAGVVEAAYYLDGMDVELIADGCHLPNSLLKLAVKSKGVEHVALITDAMRAAGENVTESYLGDSTDPTPVVIEDGVAKLLSREAFGGSIATTDRLLKTILGAGVSLCDGVKMLTENPVRMMGIQDKIGKIEKGYAADLCIFNENIEIACVFKQGEIVFEA